MIADRFARLWQAAMVLCAILLLPSLLPASGVSGATWLPGRAGGQQLAAAVQGKGAGYGPAYTGCGGDNPPVVDGDYEQQVVGLVNAARASQTPPLPPLKRVAALDAVARYHAADMGRDDYFAHDTYDRVEGNLTIACAWFDRLASYYDGGYKGENIAAGFSTPRDVMNGWLTSASHRANILSADFREIGVGYYAGSGAYFRYWVQDFGQRGDSYPLVVNGEAAATNSRTVDLYVYGNWQEMRLRNDDGQWGEWQPFRTTSTWTLGGGTGYHTVYVELRSGTTTASGSDSIYLNTGAPALANVPDDVAFIYSIPDQRFFPPHVQITPLNGGDNSVLTWATTSSGGWFGVSPMQGSTPDPFEITPMGSQANAPGTYTGTITVTTVGDLGVEGSPRRINLRLSAVDSPVRSVFLPTVMGQALP